MRPRGGPAKEDPVPITTVDGYLATVPAEARPALDKLRATIAAAIPKATETISYRILAYRLDGRMVVWCAGFKDHLSLYPASAGVRKELAAELEPYLSGKGTIRFDLDERLPVALVKKVVKVRVKEDEAAASRPKKRAPAS
jgi:uncharacterized protein YdhG (YjbR/CyaY superfamily)